MTFTWQAAAETLQCLVGDDAARPARSQRLDEGQRTSLTWIAQRLRETGVVLADEVGTGKTRIACAVVHAVLKAGGRAAVVVPHGLMHQWTAESRKLNVDGPPPKCLTTFTQFLRASSSDKDSNPRPSNAEWWLISHGFRPPLVRSNSYVWRAALPAFVELQLASRAKRSDGRTRLGRLHREIEQARASWWGWNGMARIASEIAPRVRNRSDLRKSIKALPPLKGQDANNDELLAEFGGEGCGRRVTEELLGVWLGEFDLLVIDEAHKGRGEVDLEGADVSAARGTVLTRLVDVILKQPPNGRRLCLTATPMELELSQWIDLLARARRRPNLDREREVIKQLEEAAQRACVAPDEGVRLDDLCEAARKFSRTLSPYVTRRRRDDDPLIKLFRRRAERPKEFPHPHRHIERLLIGWTQTVGKNSPWIDVLFAAEGMSESARWLSLADTEGWPRAVRDAYTKLAAGHVSIDLVDTSDLIRVPESGVDDHTKGKIGRVAYWYRCLRHARRRVVEQIAHVPGAVFDPDAEHPRILAAVREIEKWTALQEKVLVFGVFLRPLRLLCDVLNVRHALRAADLRKPISHAVHTNPALLGIALREVSRLREEGALTGRLEGSNSEVRRALQDSHKLYERLRPRVREGVKKPLKRWLTDATVLGGAAIDRELWAALRDHLVSFILDDLLAETSESDLARERFDELAEEFLEVYLRPLLGELGEEDEAEEKQFELRQATLRRALLEDHDGRQSLHARLMQGQTRWETRRYLQASFNRRGASPWVLVAQSQVGREGLNLHESCRVVIQFHAEWSPAVLEQQVGRVDRKGSLWEQLARKWLEQGGQGSPPYIEVRQLVFEGTYDAFQWDRVIRRQHLFDASLFGALLPIDAWQRVPIDRREELILAAPSFTPPAARDAGGVLSTQSLNEANETLRDGDAKSMDQQQVLQVSVKPTPLPALRPQPVGTGT